MSEAPADETCIAAAVQLHLDMVSMFLMIWKVLDWREHYNYLITYNYHHDHIQLHDMKQQTWTQLFIQYLFLILKSSKTKEQLWWFDA